MTRKNLCLFLLWIGFACSAYGQDFVVKNNLLYDATLTPNLGFEFNPAGSRLTFGVNAGYRPWPTDDNKNRKYRHLMIAPQMHIYLNDSVYHKGFIGLTAIYSHYNVASLKFPFGMWRSVRDERRQGNLYALGVSYGRSFWLDDRSSWIGRHLRMEVEAGPDFGITSYTRYDCGHCGAERGKDTKVFVMPKLSLQLAYNIVGRDTLEKKAPVIVTPPAPIQPKAVPEEYVPQLTVPFVEDFQGAADNWRKDNPVLAHESEYKPYDKTRILRKEKGMLYVHFPLDKTTLLYDFSDNGPILDRIVDITRDIMADSTSSVRCIQIVGLASVEGNIPHNQELSEGRAQALKRYVQERVDTPDSLYEINAGGEAWTEFRDQVNDLLTDEDFRRKIAVDSKIAEPTEDQLREALDIIDNETNPNRREQRLKRHATWPFMRDNILADQRNSGYVRIYYDYVPDENAKAINEASELLNAGRYDEALARLEGVKDDPRAANTLGTTLFRLKRYEEAKKAWQYGADNGNEAAGKNLREYMYFLDRQRQRQDAIDFNRRLTGNTGE